MTTTTVLRYRVTDSPVGPITLAGDDQLTHLRMDDQTHEPDRSDWRSDPHAFDDAAEQLAAYFVGDLVDFDLDLRLEGTEFQRQVWAGLQDIPYGETWSYGELADHIGRPGASRAVGMANGRNPIGIIVPCHRVIGADGSLTGYGGGLERKQLLLQLERDRTTPRLDGIA
jgi:methylated-DNA-[protein]-cysteine S-methyltransferase